MGDDFGVGPTGEVGSEPKDERASKNRDNVSRDGATFSPLASPPPLFRILKKKSSMEDDLIGEEVDRKAGE